MYSDDELTDILNIRLSKKRLTHSLNVAAEAKKLAEFYGYENPAEAYTAGLIHDCCKEVPTEEQLAMVKKSRRNVCEAELLSPALYHAIAGAYYAEHVFGFTDEDFLNSIRYHTTARANMSRIEEIVYLADLISAERSYKDVDRMRRAAYQSVDYAMLEALRYSVAEVVGKGAYLPLHTIEAYNQYTKISKNGGVK
ncbi:MAG: bis(5'-nucleosyl)-tetraphosphatase (symmetrical) YqeK [Oscillospiraceae bacterium]|nr:bis(5'-nucleosyl)-tetraphosphatase (symmetrical) YqeK [Oscillospiraceae bacterium]